METDFERQQEEEEKLWNSWNEQSVATIFMDAQRINNVFASIKMQLDILRDRQNKLQGELNEFADLDLYGLSQDWKNGRLLKPREGPRDDDDSSVTSKVRKQQATINLSNYVTKEEFLDLKMELENLRNEVRNKSEIENRFLKLEGMIHSVQREMVQKQEIMALQMSNQNLEIAQNTQMIHSIEDSVKNEIERLKKEYDEKILALEVTDLSIQKDFELKMSSLKDIIALDEMKMKQMEGKLNNTMHDLEEIRYTLDNFPKNHLESIQNSIQELYHDKADRDELATKADLDLALTKADLAAFQELASFTEELERRFVTFTNDSVEKLRNMEGKLDHRSDRIVSWCLKQLRKELKNLNVNENDRDGTDIGKIRCLVCDQPTSQVKNVTENVFGGPGFVQTIKGLHRGRSRSPPGTQDRERENSPPRRDYGDKPPPLKRDQSPSELDRTNKAHTRPLSGGQHSPEHTQYGNKMDYYEDPDYMADFKYRASSVDFTNANTTKLPPANKQHTQSAPLIHITSGQHPDGSNLYGKGTRPEPSPQAQGYKDMDSKYNRKSTGVLVANNNAVGFNKKSRPISAPIKRSTTSAKLKPMGKVITDEDAVDN